MFAKDQLNIRPIDWPTWLIVTLTLCILPALYVELTGDFPGATLFYGQEEDSWLAGVFLNAHPVIVSTPAVIWHGVESVLGAMASFFA